MFLRILLIVLIIIEILFHGDAIDIPLNEHLRPIIIAIIGIVIGWIGIVQSQIPHQSIIPKPVPYIKYIFPACFILVIVFVFNYLNNAFTASPVTLAESDIVPTIQELVNRFLNGEQVYRPVDFGSWQVIPGYMPMQWMPFSIAALSDIDFRWTPYIILAAAICILYFKNHRRSAGLISLFIIIGLLLFLSRTLVIAQPKMYLTTIEWMMASFYILLCAFLDSKKYWLIGLVLFLCCFSRYSLLFWLLPLAVVFWDQHSLKFNLSIAGVVLALGMITYFIPYFFHDPSIFSDAIAYYESATVHIWTPREWIAEGMPADHIGKGYGFAHYFWAYLDHLPMADRVGACITTHRIVSIGAAIGLTLYYIKLRANIVHSSLFLLAVLKIYFVFFYGFIQIPYLYLMVVPCVISIMLLYPQSSKEPTPTT